MKYREDYFGFVYLWFDTKRRKFIIGSHHGSVEDSYTTSTGGEYVCSIFKVRPGTMKRRVLEYCTVDSFKETQDLEQKWLNLRPNIAENRRYYNRKNWASGGIDRAVHRYKPLYWTMGHVERQKKLAAEGKHNFTSEHAKQLASRRLEEGTHHFLYSNFNKKPFQLFCNGELIAEFSSKVEAVRQGLKAGMVDRLRKNGKYTVPRGSRKKFCKSDLFLFKKDDKLEYREL